MKETLEKLRQEKIREWENKYQSELRSCFNEVKEKAVANPTAKWCVIKRKRTSKEFREVLSKRCSEEGMAAEFGFFGKIKIWFKEFDYIAYWWGGM